MELEAAVIAKGRPREFCKDAALAAALKVFWSKGFEGASLSDLTEAMGVTRPSLYAAFGNKEALFRKALDLYDREKLAFMSNALEAPTCRGVAERLLRSALALHTDPEGPRGCLSVISAMACGEAAEGVKAEVVARRAVTQALLARRFRLGLAQGDLPAGADPEGLVGLLMAVMMGMAVQAGSGVGRETLERLVESALALWPSP